MSSPDFPFQLTVDTEQKQEVYEELEAILDYLLSTEKGEQPPGGQILETLDLDLQQPERQFRRTDLKARTRALVPEWSKKLTKRARQRGQLWNRELDMLAAVEQYVFPGRTKTGALLEQLNRVRRWLMRTENPEAAKRLTEFDSERFLMLLVGDNRHWNEAIVEATHQALSDSQPLGKQAYQELLTAWIRNRHFPIAVWGERLWTCCQPADKKTMRALLDSRDLATEVAHEIIEAYPMQGEPTERMLIYQTGVRRHPELRQQLIERMTPNNLLNLARGQQHEVARAAFRQLVEKFPDELLEAIQQRPEGTLAGWIQEKHIPKLLQARKGPSRQLATRLLAQLTREEPSLWERLFSRDDSSSGRKP